MDKRYIDRIDVEHDSGHFGRQLHAVILAVVIALAGSLALWVGLPTPAWAAPQHRTVAQSIVDHRPLTNAVGVDVAATITSSIDVDIDSGTVHTGTWIVHSSYGGQLAGTYTVAGKNLAFDPSRPFFAGEQVQVIATGGIQATDGRSLSPVQWGFLAGPVQPRCVAGFHDISAGLPNVYHSSVAWGDYDNDGDLDILLTGRDGYDPIARVYRNDASIGGGFVDIGAGLTDVSSGSVAWGDYDNDGDLDILLTGVDLDILLTGGDGTYRIARVYRNDGSGSFTDIDAGLPGVSDSSVAWGDYDNDGDLDILLTGRDDNGPIARVYRNDASIGGGFVDIGAGLTGVTMGSVAWGDYDNDGDLDILLTGHVGSDLIARVYRNDGSGSFTDIDAGLPGVSDSYVAWGDYDNDGDLDILLTGWDVGPTARVYRNDGSGSFTDIGAGLTGVSDSSVAWGDYDNDGDLDILLTGWDGSSPIARVYRNDFSIGGGFSDISAGLPNVYLGSVAWGDYDNDGDLDILLTGDDWSDNIARIYRNDDRNDDCAKLVDQRPLPHAVGVTVTVDISGSLDAPVDATSVDSATWVAHGGMSGRLMGTYTVSNTQIAFDPGRNFFAGEQVQVIATDGVQTMDGRALAPAQWGFTAGPVQPRCVAGFHDISAGLPNVYHSSVAWGDYDNDGDLDILLTGWDGSAPITRVYRNDGAGSRFADIDAGLPGLWKSSVAWGDYDNDGDLDILLSGTGSGGPMAEIYRNDVSSGGGFHAINAQLYGVEFSGVAWGDYDNDGDLDILLTGWDGNSAVSKIYRNELATTGEFVDIEVDLPGVALSTTAWGDYDNDGDLDILLVGYDGNDYVTEIYRNDINNGGSFSNIGHGLTDAHSGSAAWGDYDNDGDLDILLTGNLTSKIYRNDVSSGDGFNDIGAGLPSVTDGMVAWGDYDNDGDRDVLLSGVGSNGSLTRVYRNDVSRGGGFVDFSAGLPGAYLGSAAWGDYDNDGDLDILLTGRDNNGLVARVYRNDDCATLVERQPAPHAVGVTVTVSISGTVDAPVDATSVDSATWVVHGGMSGLLAGTYAISNTQLVFDPSEPFFAGEQVQVIATGGIQATDGRSLSPVQWGFLAGPVQPRCVAGFHDTGAMLPGVSDSYVAWGDYDNDGDLDILLTGWDGSGPIARVYRNDASIGGGFVDIGAGLTGVSSGSVAWGDYDNDGDLDILLTGFTGSNNVTEIYRNDTNSGGRFSNMVAQLPGVAASSVAWGDYDNDGDLDILLTGNVGGALIAKVYRNDAGPDGGFVEIDAGLSGVSSSAAAWGDYDNDGDLDILLTGNVGGAVIARVYRNNAGPDGGFVEIDAGLSGVESGSVAWGDYDNDGDLDILLTGVIDGGTNVAPIYRNTGGGFMEIDVGLSGVSSSAVAWGDYDNDGDLDILLTGWDGSGPIARVYRNDFSIGGGFSDISAGLPNVYHGSVAWGDYDNDGDLDILLTGRDNSGLVARVYRNDDCADLVVSKQVAGLPQGGALRPGASITYTLAVTNGGVGTATNTVITDRLPVQIALAGVAYATSGGFTLTQQTTVDGLVWTAGDLPPGASAQITLTGLISPALQGASVITNLVLAATASQETTVSNNMDSVPVTIIEPATLTITKVVVGPATDGPWMFHSAPEPGAFDLPATGGSTTLVLDPGSYTVTETVRTGYVTSAACSDGSQGTSEIAVDLAMGAAMTCIFTNTYTAHTLDVQPDGNGSVRIEPAQATYTHGTVVTLSALADSGWMFAGWSGDTVGSDNPLTLTLDGSKLITATFTQHQYTLDVATVGSGSVNIEPKQATYTYGMAVTLTASADSGWAFAGWSGDSVGSENPLPMTMDGSKAITATFIQNQYTLDVGTVGNGSVSMEPAQVTYTHGQIVTLTASADSGWTFDNWNGDAAGTDNPVTVTIEGSKHITATFTQNQYTLNVGTVGSGSVSMEPVQVTYTHGQAVTLTATADSGWMFSGWSGDLHHANTSTTLVIDSDKVVTATFSQTPPVTHTLTINRVGNGSVSPSSGVYVAGTKITLTAVADSGWVFSGWSGAVNHADASTTLVMDSDKVVTAFFSQKPPVTYTLEINEAGYGFVSPGNSTYVVGEAVTLTASAESGWSFRGWSGAASGSENPLAVTIDSNKSITATFTQNHYPLDMKMVGSGTVGKAPDEVTYAHGTVVTLTASADSGWTFDGWTGAVNHVDASTTLVMDSDKVVTVTFSQEQPVTYALAINEVGHGSVSPHNGDYVAGTAVTLTASADSSWTFDGWTGDVNHVDASTTLVMDSDKVVTATFSQDSPVTYTLTTSVAGSGSVSPDGGIFEVGSAVTLTASADRGWVFRGWSGAVNHADANAPLAMDGNKVVTATFSQEPPATHTLTITEVGSGSVSPHNGDYVEGTEITLTAKADSGWTFTGWSGDFTGNDNPLTVTMDSSQNITATFAEVVPDNSPPAFTSSPALTATVGMSYTYQTIADDPDAGDVLVISAPTLASWLTLISTGNGAAVLHGVPHNADLGAHMIVVHVEDSTGALAVQTFTVTVVAAPTGTGAGTLHGAVIDDTNAGIPNVEVNLADSAGSITAALLLSEVTDTDGSYRFEGVPAGAYQLTVVAQGYLGPDPLDVTVRAGRTTVVEPIMLQSISVEPAATTYLPVVQATPVAENVLAPASATRVKSGQNHSSSLPRSVFLPAVWR